MEAVFVLRFFFLFKYQCIVLLFLFVINDAEFITAEEVVKQSVYNRNFYLL